MSSSNFFKMDKTAKYNLGKFKAGDVLRELSDLPRNLIEDLKSVIRSEVRNVIIETQEEVRRMLFRALQDMASISTPIDNYFVLRLIEEMNQDLGLGARIFEKNTQDEQQYIFPSF